MKTTPRPGGETCSVLTLVPGSKPCDPAPTTKTERATAFLEAAYDGAQARIEVLEDRLRKCHGLLHRVAHTDQFDKTWMLEVLEALASMPDDPTIVEGQ